MRVTSLAILLAVLGFALQPLALGVSGPCCCVVVAQQADDRGDERGLSESRPCCSLGESMHGDEESDEPDDDREGCCDCHKLCCSGAKVHIGQTAPVGVSMAVRSAAARRVIGDQTAVGSSHIDRLKRPPRDSVPA
ncbi:MAG: hypothetical protein AAGD00_11345 [Planctomycetota bacterium]